MRATDFDELTDQSEKNKPSYQHGYEAGHHDGLAAGMARTSDAYDRGYEAAIRDFWRGVCERLAKEADDESASLEGDSDGYPQMSQRTSDWYRAEAKAKTAEAAQLRAWAKEGA